MTNVIRPLDIKLGYQKNTLRFENDTILDGDCKAVKSGLLKYAIVCNHNGVAEIYEL